MHGNVASGDGLSEDQFVALLRKMDAFSIRKSLKVSIVVRCSSADVDVGVVDDAVPVIAGVYSFGCRRGAWMRRALT